MDITSLLIQLVAGAVGGNVGGTAMKDQSLGPIGNTIAGAVGGLGGGTVLGSLIPALASAAAGGSTVGNLAASGVGGLVLQIIVGLIKSKMGN
ncbi:MAG: hypothetical protein KGO53_01680 [Alphaproteobacteria bacterium]|nr:hypothetical protein [Alphaproteobacteria bacterium]